MDDITSFRGPYRWLSNFWPSEVLLEGRLYPTVENAYQAAKAHPSQRAPFTLYTPAQAKKMGRKLVLPPNWDTEKVELMRRLVAMKFSLGSPLAEKLISTGNVAIVEGNSWGDTFWGVCRGVGKNKLGEILVAQRAYLHARTR